MLFTICFIILCGFRACALAHVVPDDPHVDFVMGGYSAEYVDTNRHGNTITNRSISVAELREFVTEMTNSEAELMQLMINSGIQMSYQTNVLNAEHNVDFAENNFFSSADGVSVMLDTTFPEYVALLDNYEPMLGIDEIKTTHEDNEENAFLNKYLKSASGNKLFEHLREKGYVNSKADLKLIMKVIWFQHYSRTNGYIDSSGFEHVFLGELKTNGRDVSGLHNWVQFYHLENTNAINYYGYTGYTQSDHFSIAGMRFSWNGHYKKISTVFLNTSPYLEISLYTLCFLTHRSKTCPVSEDFYIIAYPLTGDDGSTQHVGTSYPVAQKFTLPPNNVAAFTEQEFESLVQQLVQSESAIDTSITANELQLCQHLISEDSNSSPDNGRLFCGVSSTNLTFAIREKYSKFLDLFDNYQPQRGQRETRTIQEINEENAFLNNYVKEPSGHLLFEILQRKHIFNSKADFKDYLRNIWFELYPSSKDALDSSGFENVFLGELDTVNNSKIVFGLHNWMRLYLQQEDQTVNYWGYRSYNLGDQIGVINARFNWGDYYKDASSIMLYTNPHLELSLYTWCSIAAANKACKISDEVNIITKMGVYDNHSYILTAHPEWIPKL